MSNNRMGMGAFPVCLRVCAQRWLLQDDQSLDKFSGPVLGLDLCLGSGLGFGTCLVIWCELKYGWLLADIECTGLGL